MDQTHPPAEIEVDVGLATELLRRHCPSLANAIPLLVDEGWDNVTYRVGPLHALRLPRRRVAVELLLNEQRWLPSIASRLSLDVPMPVHVGSPSELFPWPWSVVRWVPGETVAADGLDERSAMDMAAALRALHRPAPAHAPSNPYRGLPLVERGHVVEPRLEEMGEDRLVRLWASALEATPSPDRVWLHGDLHPRNVIVRDGRLSGIIDWGDLTAGDRATDLACAWTLFEAPARNVFLDAYGPDPHDLVRATGWAVNFGSALVDSGEPRHVPIGRAIIRRLLEG